MEESDCEATGRAKPGACWNVGGAGDFYAVDPKLRENGPKDWVGQLVWRIYKFIFGIFADEFVWVKVWVDGEVEVPV
jgi:hypothetical protein